MEPRKFTFKTIRRKSSQSKNYEPKQAKDENRTPTARGV